jgi:hypothetical protein
MDTTDTGPAKAVSQLSEHLAHTAESQRALLTEMATFAKDESLRFVNLRLERHGEVLEKLQTAQGLGGVIGVQQEWLRDLLSDYAGQQTRFAGAFRGVAHTIAANVTDAASETVDRMHGQAQDNVHQGAQAVADTQAHIDGAVHDMDEQVDEATQH